jgi:GNAT superfamily N-acetyltransferase
VATVYGEPAGYLLAVYVFSLEHQGVTAEIDEFFVLPPHRGLGLGHQMLAVAEAQFRLEGCTNVSLQLGRSNDAARKFYRSNGFEDRAGFDLVSKKL